MKKPKYVEEFTDRLGRVKRYLRIPGRDRVPLPVDCLMWSPAFLAAYDKGMNEVAATPIQIGASRTKLGSFDAAVASYYQSSAWTGLAAETRRKRRIYLDKFRSERGHTGTETRGERPLRKLEQVYLQAIIGKLGPHPQRDLVKTLRHFMGHCVAAGMIERDPTIGLKVGKRIKSSGFRTWSEDDIAKFEAVHPVGSPARLAFSIMLYLGLRRSDAVRLGPHHVRIGLVKFTPQKTARSTGFELQCPVHPELARVIAATPTIGVMNYIIGKGGKPLKSDTLGAYMRAWCNEAQLPECTAHGLRKAVAAAWRKPEQPSIRSQRSLAIAT